MPLKYKLLNDVLDTNNDNYISDKEIEKAKDILYKANIQKNKDIKINNINYFQNNI